jgi:hypothetical protein
MGNIFEDDFRDFLSVLNNQKVDYILVGGYSVIIHGYPRTTGDVGLWVRKTQENCQKLVDAYSEFGMPTFDMTEENFLNHPDWDVFSFGRPPAAIDIMTKVKGLDFDQTFEHSKLHDDGGLLVRTIHKNDLLSAKTAASRPKDLENIR